MQSGFVNRARDYVAARGSDAGDFLQRMLSSDVVSLEIGAACDALLLTPKARLIAPVRVLRRAADDYLLLTEPGCGDPLRTTLLRARFAAKVDIEPENHRSSILLGGSAPDGAVAIPVDDYGVPALELLDADPPASAEPLPAAELERLRIRAGTPAWGRELDDRVLPAEAGLVERAVSLTKGCYPGQEPIARLHYRGHVNRALRTFELEGAELPAYDEEIRQGERVVGRVTSAVAEDGRVLALGYVRTDVSEDGELSVDGREARLH